MDQTISKGFVFLENAPLLDAFVKESTDFATWDEMVRTATGLRYRR